MDNDNKQITNENFTALCLNNGMPIEEVQRLLKLGIPLDELIAAAKSIVERGESLADDNGDKKPKRAAEFGEANTHFVWYPYIPEGDYTVLMADGGTGKTIFCCGIVSAISTGKPLPGEEFEKPKHTALIISAEDRGELLKQRLKASGADLDMIYILDCMDSEGINFTEGEYEFKELIRTYNSKLVIIDPWHAFLGAGVDINRVNAVRPVFQKLANIAKECECGLILVSHVNKRAQGDNANNAATGSTDFINAARSALRVIFSDDQDEENIRIAVHTKSNYAKAGESVRFRINDKGGLEWAGFSEITRHTLEEAARWRKKPSEVITRRHETEDRNRALIDAIIEKAEPGKNINISYDEMKELYGEDIFGYMQQPKRTLDSLAKQLSDEYGIIIKTGKRVLYKKASLNGFGLYKPSEAEEPEQLEINKN